MSVEKFSVERVNDKKGERITEGDYVWTRYRGGTHEGKVFLSMLDIYTSYTDQSCTGSKHRDG